MKQLIIDSHIHLDWYKEEERSVIFQRMEKDQVKALITVSSDLTSCENNLSLALKETNVFPAFGFHPEQELLDKESTEKIFHFIEKHQGEMIAVGEVGLPYYLRREDRDLSLNPYLELLEEFVKVAAAYEKPIVLHAVYEDASIVCDMLEKHSIEKAHFHWFKGDVQTIERLITNGYFISVTPDLLYEEEIQTLVQSFPLKQMMIETDGPWAFKGPFAGKLTEPKMLHQVIAKIAQMKKLSREKVYKQILANTKDFYQLFF